MTWHYTCMLSHFSHIRLFVTPWTVALPCSSVHGILQARILEWVAIPFSRVSSWPRDWTHISYISCLGRWILYHWGTREACRKQLLITKTWPFFENPSQLYPCQFLCQRLLVSLIYGFPLILGSQDILLSPLQLGKATRLILINGLWMEAGSTQGVGWSRAKIIFKTPAYINNSI